MNAKISTLGCISLCMACASLPSEAQDVWPLSVACETALAEAAAPTYVREQSGVYVLGEQGYEMVKPSSNGYICMVERNSSESLVPQCFDKIGQDSHVRVLLDEGKKIREGVPFEQIQQDRSDGFFTGKYTTAKGHGVVYMASDYNFVVNGDRRVKIAPHVMYHAPGVTNADIASKPPLAFQNRGMPFVAGQGPMGFMISFTQFATDSSAVEAACSGELPSLDSFRPFPPPQPTQKEGEHRH